MYGHEKLSTATTRLPSVEYFALTDGRGDDGDCSGDDGHSGGHDEGRDDCDDVQYVDADCSETIAVAESKEEVHDFNVLQKSEEEDRQQQQQQQGVNTKSVADSVDLQHQRIEGGATEQYNDDNDNIHNGGCTMSVSDRRVDSGSYTTAKTVYSNTAKEAGLPEGLPENNTVSDAGAERDNTADQKNIGVGDSTLSSNGSVKAEYCEEGGGEKLFDRDAGENSFNNLNACIEEMDTAGTVQDDVCFNKRATPQSTCGDGLC
eukprot:Lankesteria_metandrocarpae@DN6220_c0_g1_i1.p1